MHSHLAGYVTEHHVSIFKLHSESGVGEVLHNFTLHLNSAVL